MIVKNEALAEQIGDYLVKFRICQWIDREDFERLIEVADYIGRKDNCSLFSIKTRVLENPTLLEKTLDILGELGAEIEEREATKLNNIRRDYRRIILEKSKIGYLLRSKILLNEYLGEYRNTGCVKYSRSLRAFIVKPHCILEVVKRLKLENFSIQDNSYMIETDQYTLDLELRENISLRNYQVEALEAWRKNTYRGVIALPTGSGKTIIGISAIAELKQPTLIIVYTKEQMNEWLEKIRAFTKNGYKHVGLFYSEKKQLSNITISTYQSAFRHMDLLYDKFRLLIVDEVHHLPADKFRYIAIRSLAPFRMGLSATPYREDGRHVDLFNLMGGLVYEKSFDELEKQGFIAPYEIIPIYVKLDKDEEQRYRSLKKKLSTLAKGRKVEELVKAAQAGDRSAIEALRVINEMRKIAALSKNKLTRLEEILNSELRSSSKVLVFTQFVAHAEELGRKLGVPVLTGKTIKSKRKLILDLFKNGRYRAIIFTTVGDEGIDVPDANVGIIVSSTSSRRQFIQRLGRLLRPQPGKVAKLYILATRGTPEERILRKMLYYLSFQDLDKF